MTTLKTTAFLMCPTSRTTQLGGTPLESGEAGGHIKKASWVHVLDALPLALRLPCEIARVELQQFIVGQEAANADVVDVFAGFKASIKGLGPEFAELGGGHLGCGGLHLELVHIRSGPHTQASTKASQCKDVEFNASEHTGEAGNVEKKASDAALHGSSLQLLSGFDGLRVLPLQHHQPRLGDALAKSPIADDVLLDAQSLRQVANAFCLLNRNV